MMDYKTVFEFYTAHHRLPQLERSGDPAPYSLRGWMLPYIELVESHQARATGETGRWEYHLDNLTAGAITGPIPQRQFRSPGNVRTAAYKQYEAAINTVERDAGSMSAVPEVIRWMAYGTGVITDPLHRFSSQTEETLYRAFNFDPILREPCDYWGYFLSEYRGKSANWTGFYPTPQEVVQLMGMMTMENTLPHHTVMDPAVGTGRMLLAASNYSLRLYGIDIDQTCVLATLINGAIFAPWLAFPLPATIFDTPPPPPPPLQETPAECTIGWTGSWNAKGQGLLFG